MLKVLGGEQEGKFKAVASGTLPNGKPVVVNSDGTVSSIFSNLTIFNDGSTFVPAVATNGSGTLLILYRDNADSNKGKAVAGTISGSTVTLGSPVEVSAEIGNSRQSTSVIYDPDNSKFVIAYRDDNNSNYLTSRVVTVTGTTVSLGTAVVIDSQNVITADLAYDTSANKVVCGWRGGPSTLVAGAVGTVSGTSISFGSTTTVASKRPNYISIAYDSNANKTAFFYRDDADTADGYYVVCTVSGTSISGGTTAAFNAADVQSISATYDSTAQKIVVAYQDVGNNNYGSVRVGTISGTTMSFGTEVNFSGTSYVGSVAAQYDSASNKTFIIFDKADSALTAVLGTVSGTSISIGSENTISSGNAAFTSAAFSDGADKVLVVFTNYADSQKGSLLAIDTDFEGGNLTSENYIGISTGGEVADTGNARVDIIGTVNKDQTGLTAGEKYYVQNDGTLSTTAGSPSVLAGTAISSTELLVKT